MNLRNNKGISGIDISISIGILIIFTAIIANMFLNVDSARKMVTRKANATYVAINTMEAIKDINYENLDEGSMTIGQLNGNVTNESCRVTVPDGYSVSILITNYKNIKSDESLEDVIKKVEVTVSYTEKKQNKNVKLETVVTKTEDNV